MRQILTIIISLILVIACNKPTSYTINGKVADDDKIILITPHNNGMLDSVTSINGIFTFKGNIDTSQLVVMHSTKGEYQFMILEPGNFSINLSSKSENNFSINSNNGKLYKLFSLRDSLVSSKNKQVEEFIKKGFPESKIRYFIDSLSRDQEDFMDEESVEIFTGNENNILGISTLGFVGNLDKFDSLYNQLGDYARNHAYTQQIKTAKNIERTNFKEGEFFKDFEGEDLDGNTVAFSDYIGNGKYVLVDFWASWCGPCHQAVPGLKKLYEEFKSDDFEILGVAVSDEPKSSKMAAGMLKMDWPMIINGDVAREIYGIKAIPQIMLFDRAGKLIAKDLNESDYIDLVSKILTKK